MINSRLLNTSSAVLLLMLITGCQPTTPGQTTVSGAAVAPLPTGRPPTANEAVGDDPCAARLHDITGALLGFYIANNNRLPDKLEQIKPYADFGTELNFTCPASGLPYTYSPAGLMAAGQNKRIIVWDPTPAHNGIRWCILMPHMAPNTAIVPEVVPIPEKAFTAYVPAIQ
jgi:hypothetical protein